MQKNANASIENIYSNFLAYIKKKQYLCSRKGL